MDRCRVRTASMIPSLHMITTVGQGPAGKDSVPWYDGFGYFQPSFALPKDAVSLKYTLALTMPGSERINGGKGLVIVKSP